MVKIINDVCDFFFNFLGFGAHAGKQVYNFQLFLCFVNISLSAWPLICYLLYSTDMHIVFWLGNTPQYVNLMVPVVLVCLNIGVNVFQCMSFQAQCARIGCFLLFLILGGALVGAGMYVIMISEGKAAELIHHCGTDPMARKLENEWQNLNVFYSNCDPRRKVDITQCPGFSEAFPNRVFTNYLEQIEYEFSCVGFCEFWAKPLFNHQADLATRCASALGNHVGALAVTIGTPTAAMGGVFIFIGVLLSGYDHL